MFDLTLQNECVCARVCLVVFNLILMSEIELEPSSSTINSLWTQKYTDIDPCVDFLEENEKMVYCNKFNGFCES